jgi:serine phosphatase RsbU (regulator of sigma subunit)
VLYTDGVIEATDASGAFFDEERLCDFSRAAHARPAEAFADGLIHHLGAWSGRNGARGFDDDVTLIVIDRLSRT